MIRDFFDIFRAGMKLNRNATQPYDAVADSSIFCNCTLASNCAHERLGFHEAVHMVSATVSSLTCTVRESRQDLEAAKAIASAFRAS